MRSILVSLALTFAPGLVAAQGGVDPFLRKPPPQEKDSGISIGLSGAYAIPMGSVSGAGGAELSKLYSRAIPLQFELGYRFNRTVYVGGYFQYAFASVGSGIEGSCNVAGVSCSASDVRFGLDVRFTLAARETVLPWVGIGAGYEIAKIGVTAGGQDADIANMKGFEFAHVSVGADFRVSPLLRIGPFATMTFAQFSSVDSQYDPNTGIVGGSQSHDITDKAFHEWLQLGLKATFDF